MARQRRLSATGLARLAAVTPAHVRELTLIGVLRPGSDGLYSESDVRRVHVAAAYERGGIAIEELGRAIRDGHMSFDYTDRIYPPASPPSGRTLRDLMAELGEPGALLPDVLLALGLARAEPDRPLTTADEQALRVLVTAWTTPPLAPGALLRAARILGDAGRRAAEGWVDLFVEAVALPAEESNRLSVEELGPRLFQPGIIAAEALEPTLLWVLRLHMVRALDEVNVAAMEAALEVEGVRRRPDREPPAIVFADISGYTRLTEELGDAPALGHAERLAHLAADAAGRNDGQLVKQLGDGVMLAFANAASAVDAAEALLGAAAAAELPPVHIGVSAGPVIERDGDYYGRTVILASRLSGVAGPGEIVLDDSAAGRLPPNRTVAIGIRELKGLAAPVAVARLAPEAR